MIIERLSNLFLNAIMPLCMWLVKKRLYEPFIRCSHNPAETQAQLLQSLLQKNRDTEFGKQHNFSTINDYNSYKTHTPISSYEDLRPLIEKQLATATTTLTTQPPLIYSTTSGTTNKPKQIPITGHSFKEMRQTQSIFTYAQYRYCPQAFSGKILGIVGPSVEGHFKNGTTYGSISGHLYKTMPYLARKKYVLPYEVFDICDYTQRYYTIVRLALEHKNITYVASANPSTFYKLLEVIEQHRESLLNDIANGSCAFCNLHEPHITRAIQKQLRPNPRRAQELQKCFALKHVSLADLWPDIKLVATWTGGSCGTTLSTITSTFPSDTHIIDLGYLASEFRGSIHIDPTHNAAIPVLDQTFYEFVAQEEWENGAHNFVGIEELSVNRLYYLFITTANGLYRYNIDDIIRVSGFFNATPTIEFIQKGIGITNITGEKLYEAQLIEAMSLISNQLNCPLKFYFLLANQEQFNYELYAEPNCAGQTISHDIALHLDRALRNINIEYESKRASDRLKPPSFSLLPPGSFEQYKEHLLAKGQREGQLKILSLQNKSDFDFSF